MFKIAIEIADAVYRYKQGISFNLDAFEKMRNGYAQVGLGVPTGIDLPGEVSGVAGGKVGYSLMDLSIGQYDTYTPLQLAQFVATIANGGKRIQTHVVKEIREPSEDGVQLGGLVKEFTPNILNTVDNTQEEIQRIRTSMQRVYYGSQGTARKVFGDFKYGGGGKTGTAQSSAYDAAQGKSFGTVNLTHVGFSPFDNPEIAYAVIIPQASLESVYKTNFSTPLARELVDKYFEIQEKNANLKKYRPINYINVQPAFTNDKIDEEETE